MENNLVSIITPMYNSEKFVSQTIDSVLSQTYTHWEMIIVDDCSKDNSVAIVEQYIQKEKRIVLLRNKKNLNAAKSRNEAIKKAKGQFIAFLDSDDIWMPHKLEKQVQFMHKHQLSMTYASYELMDEGGQKIGVFKAPSSISKKELLKTNSIGNLTGVYDVSKLGKVYFEDYGHEDYVLWLRIFSKIELSEGIEIPLAKYRLRDNSISSNKLKALFWVWIIYKEVLNINLLKRVFYISIYIFEAIKKKNNYSIESV